MKILQRTTLNCGKIEMVSANDLIQLKNPRTFSNQVSMKMKIFPSRVLSESVACIHIQIARLWGERDAVKITIKQSKIASNNV